MSAHLYKVDSTQPAPVSYMSTPVELELRMAWITASMVALPEEPVVETVEARVVDAEEGDGEEERKEDEVVPLDVVLVEVVMRVMVAVVVGCTPLRVHCGPGQVPVCPWEAHQASYVASLHHALVAQSVFRTQLLVAAFDVVCVLDDAGAAVVAAVRVVLVDTAARAVLVDVAPRVVLVDVAARAVLVVDARNAVEVTSPHVVLVGWVAVPEVVHCGAGQEPACPMEAHQASYVLSRHHAFTAQSALRMQPTWPTAPLANAKTKTAARVAVACAMAMNWWRPWGR
jgi:hypothetical protein